MNLDLAKRLKEAGFPQKKYKPWIDDDGNVVTPTSTIYIPTTDELLEALGERFTDLIQEADRTWLASAIVRTAPFCRDGKGNSPIEALAELYVAISEGER